MPMLLLPVEIEVCCQFRTVGLASMVEVMEVDTCAEVGDNGKGNWRSRGMKARHFIAGQHNQSSCLGQGRPLQGEKERYPIYHMWG